MSDDNGNTGRKILTLAGDMAKVVEESSSEKKTQPFDPTRDFVFYVAPVMGYTWDSTEVPVTLEGSYRLKDAAEAAGSYVLLVE